MDSIKWKCKNWILYFKKFSPHPFNCKKVGRVQLSSNFLLLLSLIAIVITLTCEIWTRFLKNIHQKWKYYREEKQDFERFLIFLNITAKSNKIELSEEFMVMWKEEQPPEIFCKKGVLINFANFTVLESLFLIKLQASRNFYEHLFLQNTSGRLLPKYEKNVG